MQAIILASGLNTRVRHLFPNLPKALFPVAGKPFLYYWLKNLEAAGIKEVIIVVHYQANKIKEFVKKYKKNSQIDIQLFERHPQYGPVGALTEISDLLNDKFILLYGDILFETDFKKSFDKISVKRPALTFVTKDPLEMFDDMEIILNEKKQLVKEFEPGAFNRREGWFDVGQVYHKSLINRLKKCPPAQEHINQAIWPALIKEKKLAYFEVGPVFDVGTKAAYHKTCQLMKDLR